MKTVTIEGHIFEKLVPAQAIRTAVKRIADCINKDLSTSDPLFLCILNGSFMFAADLLKHFSFPCKVSFVKLSSYENEVSRGRVDRIIGLAENIKGRHVVILEDIIDTGVTMSELLTELKAQQPASLRIATIFIKKEALIKPIEPDYCGIELPNCYVVGYGLDYNGVGRNYPDLYAMG